MKAIKINALGDSSQLKYEEASILEPGHNEVRLSKVVRKFLHACAK